MMPSSAIVTNIDADHLDTYENIEDIKDAFVQFVNKIPFYGQAILCLDDPNVQAILSRVRKPVITYGFSRQAKYRVDNLRFEKGYPVFDILNDGESLGEFRLQIPGRHNVLNATAAVALANEEGIAPDIARKACAEFQGVTRRFEFMGEKKGVMVFNDYAHHPTEATATLLGFREAFPDKRTSSAVPATSTKPSAWRSRTATCFWLPTFTPHVNAPLKALPARSWQTARATAGTAMRASWATRRTSCLSSRKNSVKATWSFSWVQATSINSGPVSWRNVFERIRDDISRPSHRL